MSFGRLGALGRGFGTLGALGGAGGSSIPLINNPSFAIVGDSLQTANNVTTAINGSTLTRTSNVISVAKTGHGIFGEPNIYLGNTTDTTYEVFGRKVTVDANNFSVAGTGTDGSTTGGANGVAINQSRFGSRGPWPWLQSEVEGGFQFLGTLAQGGDNAENMTGAVTAALALNPDVILIAAGVNNIYASGQSIATAYTNIVALIDQVTAGGKRALVLAIPPTSASYSSYSTTKNSNGITVNSQLAAYCALSPATRKFVDTHTPLYDTPNLAAFSWVTYDTLHWTTRAGRVVAQTIAAAMSSWFTWSTLLLPSASGDTGTVNGFQKFINKGPWDGTTGGNFGTSMSGTGPPGSSWTRTGTGTGVCDIRDGGDGKGFWARTVFTPGAASDRCTYQPYSTSPPTLAALGLSIGDKIALGVEVNASGLQAANFAGLEARLRSNGSGGFGWISALTLNAESTAERVPDSFTAKLFTGPITINASWTSVNIEIEAQFFAAGAAATIESRRLAIYKVPSF